MSETAEVYPFEHGFDLGDGRFANTVGPYDNMVGTAEEPGAYPLAFTDSAEIYIGPVQTDVNGVSIRSINSVLRFERLEDGRVAEQGGTAPRACPVAELLKKDTEVEKGCGNCALQGSGLTLAEMAAKNCARANSAIAYEMAAQEPEGRFMLTAKGKDAYVVTDDAVTAEMNGDELMQYRLTDAPCVVFSESWLRERGLDQFSAGMSGADGSMVMGTFSVRGERYFMGLVSMRNNMGDRPEDDQLARKAIEAVFDSLYLSDEEKLEEAKNMNIAFILGASASLRNFAHQIKIPKSGDKNDIRLREKYPELIARSRTGNVTSAMVLNDMYPGALDRGSIFPEYEARMGIHVSPITPDNCPGDGLYCHVDYRTETEYALRRQVVLLGVMEENMSFNDSQTPDPSSPDNKMASNRAEQNNGIDKNETGRTLNALTVWLDEPTQ